MVIAQIGNSSHEPCGRLLCLFLMISVLVHVLSHATDPHFNENIKVMFTDLRNLAKGPSKKGLLLIKIGFVTVTSQLVEFNFRVSYKECDRRVYHDPRPASWSRNSRSYLRLWHARVAVCIIHLRRYGFLLWGTTCDETKLTRLCSSSEQLCHSLAEYTILRVHSYTLYFMADLHLLSIVYLWPEHCQAA